MKKIMMIGKIGCGKTTLGQRLTQAKVFAAPDMVRSGR